MPYKNLKKILYLRNAQLAAGSEEVLDVETTLGGAQFWLKRLNETTFVKQSHEGSGLVSAQVG